MDFSIIVPVFNEERHIAACLEALLALEYPEDRYEIIVVDNGSTDRSVDIVRSMPRVRLLQEPEPGDFAARNTGAAASSGALLAFTDADTAPDSDWLRAAHRAMTSPHVDVVIGYLRLGDRDRGVLRMLESYEAARGAFVFDGADPELYYGFTCNQIVRRSAFDRFGPFPGVFRNSDTVFVQQVVDGKGCDAVAFREDVRVRRLEIGDFGDFLAKQHTYGRDFRRYSTEVRVRTLTGVERLGVFRRVIRDEGYSLAGSIVLLAALAVGVVAYETGRLRGAARPRARPAGSPAPIPLDL